MSWAGAELSQSLQMLRGWITHMNMKLIVGKSFVIGLHNAIPSHFGQDGGCGNRNGELIAFDHRALRDEDGRKVEGIEKQIIRG